ncbi:MAG: hypothetical protein K6E30_03205 [Lachnospiraceae bacterium]|nr:hypothetical protein [Lachnospiraceae bacterium]
MASEYIKYQLRDMEPEEPPKPLTEKEKRKNWFDYHKWHLLIGLILLVIGVDLIRSIYVSAQSAPDYQIAWVGSYKLPGDTVEALESAASAFGEDLNGNGEVTAVIAQYVINTEDAQGNEALAGNNTASEIKLMGDLEGSVSAFFLLEDPETFNEHYDILMPLEDGRLALPFTEVSGLSGAAAGSYEELLLNGETASGENAELLEGLYLARRIPRDNAKEEDVKAWDAFWNKIKKGS